MPPPNPIIHRTGSQAVTYDLTSTTSTTITLPPPSRWTSGLHWHETHTEYLLLLRGSIYLRLGPTTSILTAPVDGKGVEVVVPRSVRHEWGRADAFGEAATDEDVVVIERTDPVDGEKSIFFYALNAVILTAQTSPSPDSWIGRVWVECWVTVELFGIFRVLDNWPVFFDLEGRLGSAGRWVEWCTTHFVLRVAGVLGWIGGGATPVRRDRVPEELWKGWLERKGGKGL